MTDLKKMMIAKCNSHNQQDNLNVFFLFKMWFCFLVCT